MHFPSTDFFLWYINANLCHKSATLHWQLSLCNVCRLTWKATGCKILLYVTFISSPESLHEPERPLPLNFTKVGHFCFKPVQFYDSNIFFELQSSCKKYFTYLSGCIYRMWLRIQYHRVLLLNILCNKFFYTATNYVNASVS